jgi:hypothetical protein
MQLGDILNQLGGTQSIARELGVDESQVQNGAAALLPAILGGFKKQASGGLPSLGGLLGQLGGGGLLDEVLSPKPTDTRRGDAVLGQIFGSKDVSRAVAQQAGTRTGIDPTLLKRMLPMLAMVVAGYMAKQTGSGSPQGASTDSGGALGGVLGGLLGGGAAGASRAGGGLASLLDFDGDGNPLDDILGMVNKARR